MDLVQLKEYIIKNDKIPDILEWLECHGIKEYGKDYRCALPSHTNTSVVRVNKTNLSVSVYSTIKLQGDIISLVMELKSLNFLNAVKDISNLLGLKFNSKIKVKKKKNLLDSFQPFISHAKCNVLEEVENCPLSIFNTLEEIPYIGWIREGIIPSTQKEFGICYSIKYNRVCIPWRRWNGKENEYLGIVGRTLNPDYKLLNIPKYFPLYAFPKSITLYGLQENYKYIQEQGQIIVFEAEKSVLKAHSLMIKNCVALGGHELSRQQLDILLSLNVEIIFAMDKDMEEDISLNMCERVKHHRKTGYIIDKDYNLLGEKDSPIDKGSKVWNVLYKRIKYVK